MSYTAVNVYSKVMLFTRCFKVGVLLAPLLHDFGDLPRPPAPAEMPLRMSQEALMPPGGRFRDPMGSVEIRTLESTEARTLLDLPSPDVKVKFTAPKNPATGRWSLALANDEEAIGLAQHVFNFPIDLEVTDNRPA